MTKIHITRPQKLKYFGFGFYKDSKAKEWKCRPHQDSVKKFKHRLKELTSRKMPETVTGKIVKINQVTRGWINYTCSALDIPRQVNHNKNNFQQAGIP